MTKKFYFLILVSFLLSLRSQAQQNIITGKVLEAENGEALVGASILGGKGKGTTTDAKGSFTLELGSETSFTVSMIGFETQRINIQNGQNYYEISLKNGLQLGEVVVTALGLERDSKQLGYVVQKVDGKNIAEVKSVNFLDNLQSRVAGLTITQGSSGVGSTSKISIRGESSFTNNNPLFVVDGIPINNNTIVNIANDDANGLMEVDFGNGAMDINPDDIESVTVLKGPSAAALYGTRASNGVLVIKTKNGSRSKGMGVSFNSTTYVEKPFQLPRFQNLYGQGNSGQFAYKDGLGGGVNDNISYSYGPRLDQGTLIPQYDSPVTLLNGQVVRGADVAVHGGAPITPTPFISHPDNLKDFYSTGLTNINNLAFSTGNAKSAFRLSLTDLNSKSIIPGVNLNRKSFNGSFTFNPIRKLTIQSVINYLNTGSDNRPATKYGSENINYGLVAWLGRQTDIEPMKNYWQPGLENVQQYSYNYTFFDNPYFTLLENRNSFNRNRIFGNIKFDYEITPELSVSVRSGMDNADEARQFRRAFSSNRFKNGAYAEQAIGYQEINTDLLINYRRAFNMWNLELTAGANRMDQMAEMQQFQTQNLAQPGVFSLSNAASPLEFFQSVGRKRINSAYGLAKLSWSDKIFVDLTGRNDWSSALATPSSAANASFFYPSFSTAFILSNMLTLPSQVNFAKLRASYAEVGNDTGPYQTAGFFVAKTPVNGLPTFGDQNTIANANLKPERISAIELGADVRLFNDRLKMDFTWFNSLSKNQILSLPIAISTGYNQQNVNGGAVRNKGVEVIVGYNVINQQKFNWAAGINFTQYRNTVESLPEEAKTITLGYNRIYDNVNQTVWYQVKEGGRLGDMYGTGYVKNENGDFVLNANGQYIVDNNLRLLGNYNPDFMVGFTNNFKIGPIDLQMLIDWRQGGVLVSRTLALAGVAGQLEETADRPEAGIVAKGVVNVGTTENPVYEPNTKAVSAESYYRQYYDRNHEENNTYNASFVKLREVSVSYNLNALPIFKKLDEVRISLVGRNLFALSEMKHFDPEQVALQGQQVLSGVEDMSYPSTRNIGFKLGFNF